MPCRPIYILAQLQTWWRHQMENFPSNWPLVRGIHRWPVNSPHKGQWRGALMFSLICAWIKSWVNSREAGDLRPHGDRYDVIVMDVVDFQIFLKILCVFHVNDSTITFAYRNIATCSVCTPKYHASHLGNLLLEITYSNTDLGRV